MTSFNRANRQFLDHFLWKLISFTEYAGNLGEGEDREWREQEQQHIIQLVDRF